MKDADNIFLVNANGELDMIPYEQYQREDLLQGIVDKYPEILAGEQINPDDPPRWIVIKREAGIPSSANEGNRWAVDHLFLDQHGRPTFVEIKRSSDSRIRREVVGQMLDYAANAQKYWPSDIIKELAIRKFGDEETLNVKLFEFLRLDDSTDATQDIDIYWNTVKENLRNGQVRLLFVADAIPSELRRIIEFLNEHMPRVEVLGVEIRQYKGEGTQALVPRVIGQSEFARQQKQPSGRRIEKTSMKEFLDSCPEYTRDFFNRVFKESSNRGFTTTWGTKGFSIRASLPNGKMATYFYGYPPGVNLSQVPIFQAYLRYIEDPQIRDKALNAFLKHIPFVQKESAQHTLEIKLDEKGLRQADSGLSEVMNIVKRIVDGES